MTYQARYKKGDRIGGRYLVHQALLGGMGEVYLCLDEESNSPCALKTFQGSDLRMRKLFETEISNWISLEKYPHIVRCFHMDTADNIPFMVLEWVASDESRGTDLRSWIKPNQALDLDLALKFTIDVCRGLKHANEKVSGIVHRDLKPDNVLVNQSRQAKITDFGLATIVQQSDLDVESGDLNDFGLGQSMRVGNVVGTPAYMPPEQWRGETGLDFRTDMYAVGCILYEMLIGQWVYIGRTIRELKTQHLEAPLPDLKGDFPPEMKQILRGCLAKKMTERFDSLDTLIADLTKVYEAKTGETIPEVQTEEMTAIDYNNRGLTYQNLNKPKQAIEDLNQAIRLDPTFAYAYSNRSNAYSDLGQHDSAIQDCNQSIHLDPNYPNAYYNRGLSYINVGQHQRGIQDFDETIRLDPNYAKAYSNRGQAYSDLGQYQRAIQDFNEAIRLDPDYALAYYNRGNGYEALGQHQRAIQDYEQSIHLDPTDDSAWFNIGVVLTNDGRLQEALPYLEKADQLGNPSATEVIQQVQQMIKQASTGSTESEQEQAIRFMVEIYQQQGEAGLRQMLHQNGLSAEHIKEVILEIKQIAQASTSSDNEEESALPGIAEIYQTFGEATVRQGLEQNGATPEQIEEIIVQVKQFIKGDQS